jgi:predicted NACHT family NTPase
MKRMIGSILASSLQFGVHVKLEDMKLWHPSSQQHFNDKSNGERFESFRYLR